MRCIGRVLEPEVDLKLEHTRVDVWGMDWTPPALEKI